MYEIIFYRDSSGTQPVKDYIATLSKKTDKDSRINHSKINDYISLLQRHGLTLREPFIKYVEEDIWELRPIRNRILFFTLTGNEFILLHYFIKKTRKTPKTEIDQAKKNMKDFIERGGNKCLT